MVYKLSTEEWIILLVLSLVWAWFGYRLSESDRRNLGRTPWGLPSALWALFWFLSLVVGLVLYLIAHAGAVRRAHQQGIVPGRCGLASPMARPGHPPRTLTVAEQFPAYPRPANPGGQYEPEPEPEPPAPQAGEHAGLAAGLAPRPERTVPLPLVGRQRVDLPGVDRRPPPDRHQSGPAHRALLTESS